MQFCLAHLKAWFVFDEFAYVYRAVSGHCDECGPVGKYDLYCWAECYGGGGGLLCGSGKGAIERSQ